VEDVRASLKPGEAFVSFYFGRFRSFVWVVPKDGDVVFSSLQTNLEQIDDRVSRIRASLESGEIAVAGRSSAIQLRDRARSL
jgi:hypothetical protein